mgnify:FL=1
MSDYIRPGILAKALGVTTDCLKKRRSRGSEIFDYIVKPSGHVLYKSEGIPLTVSERLKNLTINQDKQGRQKVTKGNIRERHEEIKSMRYWNSIGKVNAKRIREKKKRIEKEVQKRVEEEKIKLLKVQEARDKQRGPRSENDYIRWVYKWEMRPNWQPINKPEKKKFSSYY